MQTKEACGAARQKAAAETLDLPRAQRRLIYTTQIRDRMRASQQACDLKAMLTCRTGDTACSKSATFLSCSSVKAGTICSPGFWVVIDRPACSISGRHGNDFEADQPVPQIVRASWSTTLLTNMFSEVNLNAMLRLRYVIRSRCASLGHLQNCATAHHLLRWTTRRCTLLGQERDCNAL